MKAARYDQLRSVCASESVAKDVIMRGMAPALNGYTFNVSSMGNRRGWVKHKNALDCGLSVQPLPAGISSASTRLILLARSSARKTGSPAPSAARQGFALCLLVASTAFDVRTD